MSDPILPERRPLTIDGQAEYDRTLRRFDRYLAALPEPMPPLAETVRAFLAALPASARCKPRWALQRRYPELPWGTMPQRDRPGQGDRARRVRVEPPVEPRPGRRLVTAQTARHYRQLVRRFAASPAEGHATIEARIRAYLAGLRPSVAHASHQALHWQYPDLDWRTIPKPLRGSRNVPRLRRT